MTVLAAVASVAVLGQVHGGDVALDVRDGRVVTGVSDGVAAVFPECVYESEFGSGGQTDEPGFDSEAGTFDPSMTGGVNIRRALRVWQGGGFATVPDWGTVRLAVGFGPLFEFTPAGDTPVHVDFGLGASSGGEFHHHYVFTVVGDQTPAVYLLELEFWASPPEIAASEPFWIVFNNGALAEDHEDAEEWVRANLSWCEPCVPDLTTANAPVGDPDYGVPDGQVTAADIQYYVNAWVAGDLAVADLTTTNAPVGDPNHGVPDGQVTAADIQYYVNFWVAGCP